MLEKPSCKPRKLRPVILTCDQRLDAFKIFVESYKKIADSLLPPILLVGYEHPEKRHEYNQLLGQLRPYKIIEQIKHYTNKEQTQEDEMAAKCLRAFGRLSYVNLQRFLIEDFPRIALEHAEEDIVFMEDDGVFSSQFPGAIEKVSQYLQSDCDLITLYSPSLTKGTSYHKKRKITDNGYETSPLFPSNDFVHAIDGNHYLGNICVAINRKALTSLRDGWEEVWPLSTAWDECWGFYMNRKYFRMYATRLSYAQHQSGFSAIAKSNREAQTMTFVE